MHVRVNELPVEFPAIVERFVHWAQYVPQQIIGNFLEVQNIYLGM